MNYAVAPSKLVASDDDIPLVPGDGIELDGKYWVVVSKTHDPAGFVMSEPDVPGVAHPMSCRDIKEWHKKGRLFFVLRGEVSLPPGKKHDLRRALRAFTSMERTEMFRRLRYCQAIDAQGSEFPRNKSNLQPLCDAVASERHDDGPHDWTTVNEWWKNWKRAGHDVRVLCPGVRRRGNRDSKMPAYMQKAIETGVASWHRRESPHMTTHYSEVVSECVKHHGGHDAVAAILERDPTASLWPSYKTFTTACAKADRTNKLLRREGPNNARYEMYPVGEGPDVRLPLQRVEVDFKYLRILIVDDATGFPLGTPYLMAGIDCLTGVVAGYDIGFDPPSYVSAARCLKHIISFKDLSGAPTREDGQPSIRNGYPVNGVPHQFILDNDSAFHSESFERSANALGCHIDFLPPGEPWKKGKIERFWLTFQTLFADMFPGKVLRIGKTQGVDYDPSKDAIVTLSKFRQFIDKGIVDVHHIGIEPGTDKRRIDLWTEAAALHPPRPIRDHQSLLELVGAYDRRKAERRGIAIFGLRYNSPELALYRSGFKEDPYVEVRYDPQDISIVWIIDPSQGISFAVPCTRPDYVKGLGLHQHRVIRRRATEAGGKGRLHMKQLLLAKAELFELGKEMLKSKKTRRTRARIAHFLGIGSELINEARKHREDETAAEFIELDDDVEDPEDDARRREEQKDRDRNGPPAPSSKSVAAPEDPRGTPADEQSEASMTDGERRRRAPSNMKVSYDE